MSRKKPGKCIARPSVLRFLQITRWRLLKEAALHADSADALLGIIKVGIIGCRGNESALIGSLNLIVEDLRVPVIALIEKHPELFRRKLCKLSLNFVGHTLEFIGKVFHTIPLS